MAPFGLFSAARVTRTRQIAATPARLWEIIGDPHHLPRWWPGVERVEGVGESGFTQVLRTRRGRPVRVDWAIEPGAAPQRLVWRQELAGSPFARVLEESVVTFELAEAGAGARVSLTHAQRLRGASRTGGFMLRRATARRLDEALAGLAAAVAPADGSGSGGGGATDR